MINITSRKPPFIHKQRVWNKIWMIMRLTTILIIISTLATSAKSYSQKVSLSLENVPIETAFNQIRQETGCSFLWKEQTLWNLPPVSISVHEVSLVDAVKACLKGLPLTYDINGNVVYIKRELIPPLRIDPIVAPPVPPVKIIIGLVTDSVGSPLPGVTIYVENNQSIGTTTDLNGRYVLKVPNNNAVLVFSMVGFQEQEIPIDGKTTINVRLLPARNKLGETVVVAFGTQKKEDVVGAITTINPEELKVPSSNLTTALAGKLAGVIAYQRSGEPGADNANFFIRGVTTFGYDKDPLILVDGIELTPTDLARLQVDDIASFSILKDATATALYGARGANGVILITTKEGKEGKAKVDIRIENSISSPTKNVQLADPITYMKLNDEAVLTRNPLGVLPYSAQQIDNTISGTNSYVYPTTDWQNILFKKYTTNQRANLNISGGGKVARYYLAATFNQDNGLLKVDHLNNFNNNIDLKTYELRSNVNISVTKTTELGIKLYGTFDDYTGPIGGGAQYYNEVMESDPASFPPYFPKDSANRYIHHTLFGNSTNLELNPFADMVKGYEQYSQNLMLAQFDWKQDLSFITNGLNIHGMFNTTRYSYYEADRSYDPYYYQVGFYNRLDNSYVLDPLNENTGTEYLHYTEGPEQVNATTYIQIITNYQRTFNKKNGVTGLLVFMMQNQIAGNAGSLIASLPARNLGLAGRFTYSYNNKYFAEFDFGYNGSEKFDQHHRWGFFPSVGLAWLVSKEKFWKPFSRTITNLKLRATYGLIGNDAIGSDADRFFYISNVNLDDPNKGATFGLNDTYHNDGVTVNRYEDPNITWETSYETNLGIDLGLFNHVSFTGDFWQEKRTHILMYRAYIPSFMGLNSTATPQASVGETKGNGVDLSLSYSQFFPSSFWIQARANYTYALSKYLVYEEPEYQNAPWLSRVGYPIDQQWGYIAERLFVDDKEVANSPVQNFGITPEAGDIKYRDVNGDGVINALDEVPLGYPTSPEIVYGFGASIGYKNFDFSWFFQGLARESFWIDVNATTPFATGTLNGMQTKNELLKAYADNHWSENNQNLYALWPRLSTSVNPNNSQVSTWFMRNGAFLRLKSAEVGYTLPKELTQRIHLNKVRFYLNGTNLFCWSRFKLWDVEMAGNGLGYPLQRVINIGVQASF